MDIVSALMGYKAGGKAVLGGIVIGIVSNPADVRIAAGGTAVFTVGAVGEALNYSWKVSEDGVNWDSLPGETSATLSVTAAAELDGYRYRCDVSGANGDMRTNPAKLIIVPPPTITKQPQDQTVAVGETVAFAVEATGEGPLSYQWQYRGGGSWRNSTVASANTAAVSFVAKASFNGFQYRCIVTDAYGSTTSDAVTLTVTE